MVMRNPVDSPLNKSELTQLIEQLRRIGKAYGYGQVMNLCEKLWRGELLPSPGGEFTVGPCAAELVVCPHVKAGISNVECDWCCATGRVTKRVAKAMLETAPAPRDVRPPWVLFVDGDKKVILPAGRPGEIADVSWMTLDQADAIVRLANDSHPKVLVHSISLLSTDHSEDDNDLDRNPR